MDSRIREGRNKLIDAFVHVVRHENNDPIVWSYPPGGVDEELRKLLPRFAFPFQEDFQSANIIDYFTFVLTALDGKFRFGFCRMSAGSESTLCLISSYPWFEIFYKVLNHLSDAQNSSHVKLQTLLKDLSEIDPTGAGKKSLSYKVPGSPIPVAIDYPNPNKLPSIPESRNLTEYYNAINGRNMLVIFASMLFERRIIVTSRKLSRLTACVYGATSLIYPLNWQHIFIPVLPAHLLDYLSAPMPYLIGVHSSLLDSVKSMEIDDAVIVDADAGQVRSSHGDLASLPSSVVSALKKNLNLHSKDTHCCLTGDKLSRAFLNAMVTLIGGYRGALVERGGRLIFDHEAFEHSRGGSMQSFVKKILQSQSFERFIEERITLFKYRKGLPDIFEEAVDASEMKNRGSVKKVNHLKAEKMLVGITKKVRKTGAKTFSSVKKRFDFKKNYDNCYGEAKAIPYPEEEEANRPSVPGPTFSNAQPMESSRGNQISLDVGSASDLPEVASVLRRQQSSSRASTINRRHSFVVTKGSDDSDALDIARKRSSSELLIDHDRNNDFRKFSCDDLTSPEADDDVVTLSSYSSESCHDIETSTELHISSNSQQETKQTLAEDCVRVSLERHPGSQGPDGSSSEGDRSENDVVGEIIATTVSEINRFKRDSVLEFPSVRLLVRALQPTSIAKRKAVISVQQLPNVKQIVQKFESSCKPTEMERRVPCKLQEAAPCKPKEMARTMPCRPEERELATPCSLLEDAQPAHTDAADLDRTSPLVARQTATHSLLDQKAKTSLSRKQAIRVTKLKKLSGSDVTDGEDGGDVSQGSGNRSSYVRQNSERYHDLLDLVKTERNSVSLELNDPFEHDFGCLLRVSTKSASMHQLNMIEQRQSASLKRSRPASIVARDKLQRNRTAVYESSNDNAEIETAARNISKKPSFRNALYVPFQVKETTERVETDDSEESSSETIAVVSSAEHPNEFAEKLNYEILSNERSSTSTGCKRMSRSLELTRRNNCFDQSWSFDGVIVDKKDLLEMFNEQDFPEKQPVHGLNQEISDSSEEESSSESSAASEAPNPGENGLSTEFCKQAEQSHCNAVSVENDAEGPGARAGVHVPMRRT